jgi:hypothetical protein
MRDRYESRDRNGNRDASRDIARGGWGSGPSLDARSHDARDVFTQGLNLPRGHDRELTREHSRRYTLDGGESRALATVGAFRVVREEDLRPCFDPEDARRRGDHGLRHRRESGLLKTAPLDGRGREVVFAGITHGQKTHDFIVRLVSRGLVREIRPGALHRGRLYHLHQKRLYTVINQSDNRHRRRAPLGRLVERVMLLDAVLDDGQCMWLATERDKSKYFTLLLHERPLLPEELPHLRFGNGPRATVRVFPDKMPIGIDPAGERHVFAYLLTRSVPGDFRGFLTRHFTLLKSLDRWTIRVLVPRPLVNAIPVYRHALYEELATPVQPSEADELTWLFEQRKRQTNANTLSDLRGVEAAKRFSAPRFRVLYRLWLQYGDTVLSNTYSTLLADKFERGEATIEFVVLARQYLHLSPLVGVA